MNVRLTILLLIILAIAAPVGWVYGQGDNLPKGPKVVQPFKLYTLEVKGRDPRTGADRTVKEGSNRIQSVRISHLGQTVKFIRDEQGNYHFDTSDGTPVDLGRWGGITLLLAATQAKRVFDQPIEDLEAYGLNDPLTIMDIEISGTGVDAPDIEATLVAPSQGQPGITGEPGGTDLYIKIVTVIQKRLLTASSAAVRPPAEEVQTISGIPKSTSIPEGKTNAVNLVWDGIAGSTTYKVYTAKVKAKSPPPADSQYFLSATVDAASKTNIVGRVEYKLEAAQTSGEVGPPDQGTAHFGLQLGDKTPDGTNYYVQWRQHPTAAGQGPITILPNVWLVDATWGDVLARLVAEPPYPKPEGEGTSPLG